MSLILNNIISAEIDEGVGMVSTLTIRVPGKDIDRVALAAANEITFHREGEGIIFRGYIAHDDAPVSEDDAEVMTIRVEGREAELRWANTWSGVIAEGDSPQDVLDMLLDDAALAGWTGTILGTGYPGSITRQFHHQTIFSAIMDLAAILNAYVRFDGINREVVINNDPPDSGIVLERGVTPSTDSQLGIVERLTEVSNDRTEIYNVVRPWGKTDLHEILDLRLSTRSSPYARLTHSRGRPVIVDVDFDTFSSDETNAGFTNRNGQRLDEIQSRGDNRAILAMFLTSGSAGAGNSLPGITYLDGARTTFWETGGGLYTPVSGRQVRYALNPLVGVGARAHEWRHSSGTTVQYLAVAISLSGVLRGNNVIRDDVRANATGTSPSLTPNTEEVDLVFDMLLLASNVSATPGAGQIEIASGGPRHVSVKRGEPSSTTMSWTLGSSVGYTHLAFSVRVSQSWFLADVDSINQYGTRVLDLPLGNFSPNLEDLAAVANSMYDTAVTVLQAQKDPRRHWGADVAWIPLKPLDWHVGDTVHLRWTDPLNPIDEHLPVPRRRQLFGADGTRDYALDLSTRNKFRSDHQAIDVIRALNERINAIQGSQV